MLCHYALPRNGTQKVKRLGRNGAGKIMGVRTMTIVRSQAFPRAGRNQHQTYIQNSNSLSHLQTYLKFSFLPMLKAVEAEVAMVPIKPASYLQLFLFQIHWIPKLQTLIPKLHVQILNSTPGKFGVWRSMGSVGLPWFLGT